MTRDEMERRRQTVWLSRNDNVSHIQARDYQWYILGDFPPHYPVPATMDNAVIALFCQPEITVWSVQWMKRELHR